MPELRCTSLLCSKPRAASPPQACNAGSLLLDLRIVSSCSSRSPEAAYPETASSRTELDSFLEGPLLGTSPSLKTIFEKCQRCASCLKNKARFVQRPVQMLTNQDVGRGFPRRWPILPLWGWHLDLWDGPRGPDVFRFWNPLSPNMAELDVWSCTSCLQPDLGINIVID